LVWPLPCALSPSFPDSSEHILWEGRSIVSKGFCDRVLNKLPKNIAKQVEDNVEPVHGEEYAEHIS
jgi:hypothetical protein